MKRIIFALTLLSMLSVSVYAYSQSVSADLEESLIRLHVLANSDAEYDQNIKLAVRDEVLKGVRNIDIRDTKKFCTVAEECANRYLEENNINYGAKAVYGKFTFPRKTYRSITLPKGEYYGVRIILGSGNGANWWCVMYPPLCVADGEVYPDKKADTKLRDELNPDTYELITGDTTIKLRFLEWIQNK